MHQMNVFGYDFDGVVSIGIIPHNKHDVIITGRCLDEQEIVLSYLKQQHLEHKIFFHDISLIDKGKNHSRKSRILSGQHKAKTIENLKKINIHVIRFFEDDMLQLEIIKELQPKLEIVYIKSNLVEK